MAGDFNFDDDDQDEKFIKYKYLDLQKHIKNKYERDSQP